jgi:hypothetical protein
MIPIRLQGILFATSIAMLGVVHAGETTTPDSGSGTETSLDVGGDVPRPHRISDAELKALARTEVDVGDPHDSKEKSVYAGTPLIECSKQQGSRLAQACRGSAPW